MKCGLTETTVEKICAVFARFPEIEKAILYGSRAKGNFKTGSDIDLTLCGEALTSDLCSTIASALDDLLLPYTIDLSVFNELNHAKLREHIERVGVLFYERAKHVGSMKTGWQNKQISDLCEVIAGQSPEGKFYNTDGKGLPFYQGKKDFGEKFIEAPTTWTTQITKIAREGDILMSVRAPVGPVNFATDEICIGRGLAAIRSRAELNRDFLFYQLLHLQPEIAGKEGAVFASINKSEIEALPIAFTSLPEQQRIVGILDEAFEGIATAKANAEKNLQNARALFESHLQSVFTQRGEGWMEKRLEQIGTTQTGSTPKTSERDNYGDFIAFIKPADFNTDGSLNYENDGLSEQGLSEARKVTANSVVMVCIGATIGKCGYCDRDITTNQQINTLTPSYGVFHKFLYYQMLTESFQRRVLLSSSQATLPIINKSKWSALTVALPPNLEEQKRIAAKFDALSAETQRLEFIYQQKLDTLEALKKSLLHQAFTGQL